jgi:hypothetical protein
MRDAIEQPSGEKNSSMIVIPPGGPRLEDPSYFIARFD